MTKIYAVFLTLISGLFFLIGGLISLKIKNKDKLNYLSVSLALIVMLGLIIFDLLPEVTEEFLKVDSFKSLFIIVIFIVLGFLILKILDFFIPDHHHDHHDHEKNKQEHLSHLSHIGIITIISLIFHNILEGGAIFGLAINDFKVGILISFSVALHNIPLGTHIFSSLDISRNKLSLSILTLSSLIGGLIFLILGTPSPILLGIITSITLGMLLYIALFELFPEVIQNISHKETRIGLIIGVIIEAISLFL